MTSKTLHYQDHAKEGDANPNEQAVVLIHGLFGDADNLSVIRRHLQAYFRVISIDLPDHGKSPRSARFDFTDHGERVANTVTSIGLDKVHVVGHSLGGKVAMWMSYLRPSLISKLVVLDIAPVSYPPQHDNVIAGLQSVDLSSITSRKEAQEQLATHVQDLGTQQFLLKSLYKEDDHWQWRFNLSLLVRDYDKLRDWPHTDKQLSEKSVLFIKGEHSSYIQSKQQPAIMHQFPNASAKIVQAGHWLHAEKPQVVNTLITKYLLG